MNSFSSPALFAFILIIIETLYLWMYLPETKQFEKGPKPTSKSNNPLLTRLSWIHFCFIFVFSGMEFTLTFLTFDRFKFTNISQGKLLGFMGITSALIQGGYVRRVAHKSMSEKSLVFQGVVSCAIGLFVLGTLAHDMTFLYLGAVFMAFTSGTVVTSLTSLASLHKTEESGAALGKFRSLGQLGRSMGPIFACTGYWILGSRNMYSICSALMVLVSLQVLTLKVPLKSKSE